MFQNNDVVKFKTGKVLYEVNHLGGELVLTSLETNKNRYNVDETKLVLVRSAEADNHVTGNFGPVPEPLTLEEMAAQTEAEVYKRDGRQGSYGRRILMALQTKAHVFEGLRDAVKPRHAKRRAKSRVAKQSRKANR